MDDVALDLGTVRVRERGSHGGHNGLRSLVEDARDRGVRPGPDRASGAGELPEDLADYVLADFPAEEVPGSSRRRSASPPTPSSAWSREGPAAAMNRFNGRRLRLYSLVWRLATMAAPCHRNPCSR